MLVFTLCTLTHHSLTPLRFVEFQRKKLLADEDTLSQTYARETLCVAVLML